jgi:hypothetical protein
MLLRGWGLPLGGLASPPRAFRPLEFFSRKGGDAVVTGMGAVGGKVVATMMAVHVAVVMSTFGGAMGPSGATVKGVVPKMAVVPTPVGMTVPVPVAPVTVVVG